MRKTPVAESLPAWDCWTGATLGAQVSGSGAGPCAFSHARPRPLLGSLPREISLREGVERRFEIWRWNNLRITGSRAKEAGASTIRPSPWPWRGLDG